MGFIPISGDFLVFRDNQSLIMDIQGRISKGESESQHLEYKDKRADVEAITKELVAFANADGGHLILGVREEHGDIQEIQNIENPDEKEEDIQNIIHSRVEPAIRIGYETTTFENNTIVSFSVNESDRLHSFEINGRPSIPYRQGSRTTYLDGYEIEDIFSQTTPSTQEDDISKTLSHRISVISDRKEQAENLVSGPAVALHLFPDIPTPDTTGDITAVSEPRPFWALTAGYTNVKGKEIINYREEVGDNGWDSYTLIQNNGMYEGVSTRGFYEHQENQYIKCDVDTTGPGLDAAVVIGVRDGLKRLEELGLDTTARVYLSLIDAKNISYHFGSGFIRSSPQGVQNDRYTSEPVKLSINEKDNLEELNILLSEIHRELGHKNGTDNIEDGEWIGGGVKINQEKLL